MALFLSNWKKKNVLLQHKPWVRKRSQRFCVDRTQTFVLDNLKKYVIDTNLCGISEFSTQNAEIPHKFVSMNVFFKISNTKVCVLTTQNPCDRFRTQTFLECTTMYIEWFNEIGDHLNFNMLWSRFVAQLKTDWWTTWPYDDENVL
jgi:hypothetical protein